MDARQKAVLGILFFLLGATHLLAQDFWSEPFEKWNRNQVSRMLNDSPWSQIQTLSSSLSGKNSGLQGEKEIFNKFTVRFFSAIPVREDYVRMMQILYKYDEMAHVQRRDLEYRFMSDM